MFLHLKKARLEELFMGAALEKLEIILKS